MMNACSELRLLVCYILTVGLTLGLEPNRDLEFTFMLPAGSTECFYQTTATNDSLEVEYQVIAGSGLDVSFVLVSPSGHRLVSDFRRSDGIHRVDPTEAGDYRLCFDNSFSKLSQKILSFVVFMSSQRSSAGGGRGQWEEEVMAESLVDYKLEDIRVQLDSMYQHLERSRQVLSVLRAFESRDRYLLEDNLWSVSFWSCVNLLVMLTVAAIQICTLRRLFDNKRVRT